MPGKYIRFQEDGSFSEHEGAPEPDGLLNYLLWLGPSGHQWYRVDLRTGQNTMEWEFTMPEWVPSGLRLMALLIT